MKHLLTTLAMLAGVALAEPTLAQTAPVDQTFRQRCQACHSVAPDGKPGAIGPNLRGVVGRKAASTAYAGYSAALKASGIVWSKAKLDQYLTAPGKLVPGTRMVVAIADPRQRAALVAYLATLR